jgi:hypothetical protein
VLVRYGGFAGHELGSQLDIFRVETNDWTSIGMPNREGEDGHPLARSVHALIPVTPPVQNEGGQGKKILALMLFGERGPAPAHLGHAGAGQFHQDAWALIRRDDLVFKENPFGLGFEELEQTGEGGCRKGSPGQRLVRSWVERGRRTGRQGYRPWRVERSEREVGGLLGRANRGLGCSTRACRI